MDTQYARTGSADAQKLFNRQINIFLFDLKNEASEHGFKHDDTWTLQLVTDEDAAGLKKLHHPLVMMKLQPEVLLTALMQVKEKLQQPLSKQELSITVSDLIRDGINKLAAYPDTKARK